MSSPLRFAVVGLGHIATKAILPAFAETPSAVCTAVVSSRPDKEPGYRGFTYEQFDEALESDSFDAVYLATPNNAHRDFAVRAAAAGKHILCEKPLAVTVEDCLGMRDAAQQHNVRLMVAYRHQFSAAHQHALQVARDGALGELRAFHSVFNVNVRPNTGRTAPRSEGGGTLPDIGIYCLNSLRHFFNLEAPLGLTCALLNNAGDPRFAHVEETAHVTLTFPYDRYATFTCSFGTARVMTYTIIGTKGSLHLDPVYDYTSDIHCVEVIEGQRRTHIFPKQNQFAIEIDHFAHAILNGLPHRAGADEALEDTRLINQLYAAASV